LTSVIIMKMALVTTQFLPMYGGVTGYVSDVCRYLIKKYGYDITFFMPKYNTKWKSEEIVGDFHIRRLKAVNMMRGYWVVPGLKLSLEKERFDVIHSHHYGYYPATAAFSASRSMNIPHVFTPSFHPPVYNWKRKFLFYLYHYTQGKRILVNSEAVLPHTETEKNLLLKYGAKKSNMFVVPNDVRTKNFRPVKAKKSRKFKKNVVMFGPSLTEERGVFVAVMLAREILSERNDTTFVFLGGKNKDVIKKANGCNYTGFEGASKDIMKNVVFLPYLDEKELVRMLNIANVFIMPSRYEAFSRISAEAEACGTPVVTTRVGALPEVVINNKTGFTVDYGNWSRMKERINFLLDNPRATKRMGKAARRHVVKKYDIKIVAEKHRAVYEQVLRK